MPVHNKHKIIILLVSLLLALSTNTYSEPTKEDKVKAAIIYKLTKFISWPVNKKSLTLCVVGNGSINSEIQKINRKSSMGRRLSVTHKMASASMDKLCDIVYIHNSDNNVINQVLAKLQNSEVLTISDSSQFASKGGIIELYRSGSRIKFAINRKSAEKARLSISSQLLNLAKIVD